MTEWNKN